MFEKVNPSHPDKLADRIAGAIVDLAYTKNENPKVAVEVLLGHGNCHIIIETSEEISKDEVKPILKRISGDLALDLQVVRQDVHLAENQAQGVRCGDNGIFKGVPITSEQEMLSNIARKLYRKHPKDGKYIIDGANMIICQSNAEVDEITDEIIDDAFTIPGYPSEIRINPLGYWTGGPDVDSGATNRKLGSDMGDAVTGGGLHGKDLSKADVSVNIYAHLKAQETGGPVELCCAIGDNMIDGKPYSEIVEIAREYIKETGGFEKFAEWGLI